MSHIDLTEKLEGVTLRCLPQGGYVVVNAQQDYSQVADKVAAFTTLPEALAWLQRNMKQLPAMAAQNAAAAFINHNRELNRTVGDIQRAINAMTPAERFFPETSDPIGGKAQ